MRTAGIIIIDGLTYGAVYSLIALGLSISFGPSRIVNFAQGQVLIFGAVIAYQLTALAHVPVVLALLIALAGAVLIGVVMERLVGIPTERGRSKYAWVVVTLAISLILEAIFVRGYPSTTLRPPSFISGHWSLLQVPFSWQAVVVIAVAVVATVGYEAVLRRTSHGRAVRAVAHDAQAARLVGINIRRLTAGAFVVGAVLTAVAGFAASSLINISPGDGINFTVEGFVALVVGGIGSIPGALFGGLLVGLVQAVGSAYAGQVSDLLTYGLLALLLLARPTGLFGAGGALGG